ncbi:MAG: Card1-like endonuclease domain-containing protein [Bacteroidota bacterium]
MPQLILLVSDQNIPNLFFFKKYAEQADEVVFVTTKQMLEKQKVRHLMDAASMHAFKTSEVILPDESDQATMEKALLNRFSSDDQYLVNLTCGTKMMFMVTYNFFRKLNSQLFYIPIGKHYFIQMGSEEPETIPITEQVNVREYLNSHGIYYQPTQEPLSDIRFLKALLREYKNADFDVNKIIEGRTNETQNLFTGIWFEQFIFYKIKSQFNLRDGDIERNVKVNNFHETHRMGHDNELDIAFVYDNELFVLEVKVSMGGRNHFKRNLDNILFKLSALNKNFGFRSRAWLITLADLSGEPKSFQEDLSRKLKILGIEGVNDRVDIMNNKPLCVKQNGANLKL